MKHTAKWEKFTTPLKTSGNVYYFKQKCCVICGLLLRNVRSAHGMSCRDNVEIDATYKRHSQCQKVHNSLLQKKNRDLLNAEGKKQRNELFKKVAPKHCMDKKLRTCLRCDADKETGEYPKFMSDGPHHRTCDKCSKEKPGMKFAQCDTSHIPASGNFMEPVEAVWMTNAEAKSMLKQ